MDSVKVKLFTYFPNRFRGSRDSRLEGGSWVSWLRRATERKRSRVKNVKRATLSPPPHTKIVENVRPSPPPHRDLQGTLTNPSNACNSFTLLNPNKMAVNLTDSIEHASASLTLHSKFTVVFRHRVWRTRSSHIPPSTCHKKREKKADWNLSPKHSSRTVGGRSPSLCNRLFPPYSSNPTCSERGLGYKVWIVAK